jgi:hypothetical protein
MLVRAVSDGSMTAWSPDQDLEALLDALTEELLAAPGPELAASLGAAGAARASTIDTMRRAIAAAEASANGPSFSGFVAPGLRAYVGRADDRPVR